MILHHLPDRSASPPEFPIQPTGSQRGIPLIQSIPILHVLPFTCTREFSFISLHFSIPTATALVQATILYHIHYYYSLLSTHPPSPCSSIRSHHFASLFKIYVAGRTGDQTEACWRACMQRAFLQMVSDLRQRNPSSMARPPSRCFHESIPSLQKS